MKTKKLLFSLNFFFFLFLFSIFILNSCKKDEVYNEDITTEESEIDKMNVSDGFLYETTENINITITVLNNNNVPISGAIIEVFDTNPYLNDIEFNTDAKILIKGITNINGKFISQFSVPKYLTEIVICPKYIGISSKATISVNSNIDYTFGGSSSKKANLNKSTQERPDTYLYLGDWDTQGVPLYLTDDDIISQELLTYINSSLPERSSVPENHPDYIADGTQSNIKLIDEAEIWLTFVHEGAGWKNAIGYYTYPTNNPPQTADDIENLTMVFPNSSYSNSGGALNSGNKVKLKYNDPVEGLIDNFPENITVAWFLVANAWQNQQLGSGYYTHYSDFEFNEETEKELKKHNVLLLDEANELFIIGFEDIKRDITSCDQDFNDAVFYTKILPFSAVDVGDISTGNGCTDTDGDGICDNLEDYPNDPLRAFNNYTFGSLAFEDLWYNKGDYDFNDLVTDYKINRVTNADNKIKDIISTYTLRAIGAGFHNGFGMEIPVSHNLVESVEGYNLQKNYINLNSNGTETEQDNTVIILFDDAYNVLSNPNGGFVNVRNNQTFVPYQSITVSLIFSTPQTINEVGIPPFNPFLIKDGERQKEIHLPGCKPTLLHNSDNFGLGDDDSNPVEGKYYLTENNLPWAIHLPETFDHPTESKIIIDAYSYFKNWAESDGRLYSDWFKDLAGYRNSALIFTEN